jgi:hypothetical protein
VSVLKEEGTHKAKVGLDRITIETDYPPTDSSWLDTRELLTNRLRHVPPTRVNQSPGRSPPSTAT